MIKALDFTAGVVNRNVVEKIGEVISETGEKEVDFTGTTILNYTHETIAEKMVFDGMIPKNINNKRDRDKIEYHRMKLLQPEVDTIHDFMEVFKKRFPVGTPCILDKTIVKGNKYNEMLRYIILIEEFKENKIIIRKYHCSKVQPKFFRAVGKDHKSLYTRTEIDFVDLFLQEIQITHPKNELEKGILDILFSF